MFYQIPAMLILSTVILLQTMVIPAFSFDDLKRFDEGTQTCRNFSLENVWAGYQTFRNLCKECHTRDNDVEAPFLYSESKTRRGWDRVFTQQYPSCSKEGYWDQMALRDRMNLNDYLYMKAAGTYDPKCAA